jgi:4-hydroxy-3-methylbut-2-enyl diphosphate reductase
VLNASCLESSALIRHFDTVRHTEVETRDWLPSGALRLGITAGASCPSNLIEDVLRRFLELRGIPLDG